MVTKQRYIYSSLDVVLCLPFHVHNYVENIFKHDLFNLHDIKVMVEKIVFPIKKLLENKSLYTIVSQIKTKKLLLIELKIKHNVIIL
jgi:uncharacterized membrane protein